MTYRNIDSDYFEGYEDGIADQRAKTSFDRLLHLVIGLLAGTLLTSIIAILAEQ